MFLVAIAMLLTSSGAEAQALATDLEMTAFETRLILARSAPTIVMRTADKQRAVDVLHRLQLRGHKAIAFHDSHVPERASMIRPRELSFERDALRSDRGTLKYTDIHALVMGAEVTHTDTVHTTTKRKLDVTKAIATGGLKMTSKVTEKHHVHRHEHEQYLLVYPTGGRTPWLLAEYGLHYASAGVEVGRVSGDNFRRVVTCLREHAPHVGLDDSLARFVKAGHHNGRERAIDEQAFMISLCLARGWLG